MKEIIRNSPILGGLARRVYSWATGSYISEPRYWLQTLLPAREPISVVQIGANDGITGDPLHELLVKRKAWSSLFVEPVPFLFNRLKTNYAGDDRFSFENSVINDGRRVEFYWVCEDAKTAIPNLPEWYDQLGGLSRTHIVEHLAALEPFVRSTHLSGITFADLLAKHQIDRIDVLHIDTEGSDFKILSQLNLDQYTPKVILFETKHLPPHEKQQSAEFLCDLYAQYDLGDDRLAVRLDVVDANHRRLQMLGRHKVRP